jgi:membrane-associated protease RseP (regulator of RpoE activity)
MLQLLGVVIFFLGLLVSIGLHEVGHMLPAKKFGVRVSEYFVGFGPTLWSRKGKETEYGLKAIPLGGYVKLVGMIPPEDAVKPVKVRGRLSQIIADARSASVDEVQEGEDYRAFYHLTWWRKVIVMFGGPLVNLVLAIVMFTIVLVGVGLPTATTAISEVAACVPASGQTECAAGDATSPASQAGLQEGDVITGVNGEPVTEWTDLTSVVAANPGNEIVLTVERDGQSLQIPVTPASYDRPDDGGAGTTTVGYLGIVPTSEVVPQEPLAGAQLAWTYTTTTLKVIVTLPVQIYHAFMATIGQEERSGASVMGIVGVGRISGDIVAADVEGYGVKEKAADMLMLLGSLNVALFAFNMIPLVPLDGGHIASAFWQGIKNGWARLRRLPRPRPVDVARMMPLAYGVFGVLIIMGAVLILADIFAPVTVG